MKIKYILYCLLVWVIILEPACNNQQQAGIKKEAGTSEDIYTCSMHPQVQELHPGNCPICGMTLIKRNGKSVSAREIDLETLLKPTNEYVISSLPAIVPENKMIDEPIRAYGAVEYDTRSAGSISSRVSGRIEKMYIRYRFQPVHKGQKIMEIYSAELLTAEQNLLFLLKNDPGNNSFIEAGKEKLRLLGMVDGEIQQLIQSGKPLIRIGVYSNYEGHVHDAGMTHDDGNAGEIKSNAPVTTELALREGMYLQKGQTLLMIMNHHAVWAALQIFPADESRIRIGDPVRIVPETDTTSIIKGRIDFIEPFFREKSKSVIVRAYFHNMSMLPIGSHLTGTIQTNSKSMLMLSQSAVISLGMNQVVFLKKEGGIIAHRVKTGIKSDTEIQILSGLSEKDSVLTNASYVIDSESFIKTASK
jgi:Cu(I)/Ag(I) efflux system membrane fusion protein